MLIIHIRRKIISMIIVGALSGVACVSSNSTPLPVSDESISAGSVVKRGSQELPLYPGSLKVGDNIKAQLATLGYEIKGVTVVNIVPSIDTKVCEEQTHILGESKDLGKEIHRVTVSRDLPFAQQRFSEAAGLTNITYLSDYKSGDFGRETGLLIKDLELLTRGVLVVDGEGTIKYIQLVPEIASLPNMAKAFGVANSLSSN